MSPRYREATQYPQQRRVRNQRCIFLRRLSKDPGIAGISMAVACTVCAAVCLRPCMATLVCTCTWVSYCSRGCEDAPFGRLHVASHGTAAVTRGSVTVCVLTKCLAGGFMVLAITLVCLWTGLRLPTSCVRYFPASLPQYESRSRVVACCCTICTTGCFAIVRPSLYTSRRMYLYHRNPWQ